MQDEANEIKKKGTKNEAVERRRYEQKYISISCNTLIYDNCECAVSFLKFITYSHVHAFTGASIIILSYHIIANTFASHKI